MMLIPILSAGALALGFILDAVFGDPHGFPHIVRYIGRLNSALESVLRRSLPKTQSGERLGGLILCAAVMLVCGGGSFAALSLLYGFSPALGFALESFLCYQLLAAKSLTVESGKVYASLADGDTEAARRHVSMIVGRDTSALDEAGITRAAVETVAENASDGVAAPLFYMAFGGAALGCLYKSVNTMDSMVGYKNDKYINFGRAAAKADDALNYIPSRICALFMVAAAALLSLDARSTFHIWRRDRRKHQSPNSAQTEAACAGALGIRLAGPAVYSGKTLDKPYIGDNTRDIEARDIVRANRLMYASSVMMFLLALGVRAALIMLLGRHK